jgi:3-oxoacyl-[acyl-carrier protein] reductase
MTQELAGRVALVTGAARNIGRAIAVELARAGANVVVSAKSSTELVEETAALARAEGRQAIVQMGDVSQPESAADLVARAVAAFGRLDILVNNAALRRETAFADLGYEEWREVMSVILDAPYLCARAALPALKGSDMGAIINIGGMSAHTGAPGRAHVVAAKSGVVGLTRALAHDLAPDGITVNCVVPGLIDTVRGNSARGTPALHAVATPLAGRRGRSEEIATMVRYLAGPQARYMTGQTLHVNGGAYLP